MIEQFKKQKREELSATMIAFEETTAPEDKALKRPQVVMSSIDTYADELLALVEREVVPEQLRLGAAQPALLVGFNQCRAQTEGAFARLRGESNQPKI